MVTVRSAVRGLVLSLAVGCAPAEPAVAPDIVLIAVDTLRADHLGVFGYPRPTSPNLDRLAAGGVVFSNATAPASWTKPSIGSLFTSRHPSEHGAVSFQHHLDPALPTLAEALRDAGYRTVGVSGNFVHVTERTGFARGFDIFASPSNVTATPDDAILSLARAPLPDGMRGRDLLADRIAPRVLAAELHDDPLFEDRFGVREQRFACTAWPWKVILSRHAAPAICDLDTDPAEETPVAPTPASPARSALEATFEMSAAWRDELVGPGDRDEAGSRPDAEALEGLRALGYVD